ncbi:hypothetical protein [Anaeromyxobacter oryzae]|uniref:Uncharacterized protein n=1 Tax=Anaeromyxobacter oryzae TaxID=2918170 RepID=A0ABM7WZL5_9BACT|nr:hypothetical protein [Anaeromyxobacter oryzae]BDG04894.1 hypothetical protein AMOR_38900 [Anaeromyxobacter oryzae]
MDLHHDHASEAPCTPECPAWGQGALELLRLRRRWSDMLEACRTAAAIESLIVEPSAPGVELPEYLHEEALVRVNLVVGRDTPEVLLDEWGVRCNLTFRGRRFDCAFPWPSVHGGVLRAPEKKRPRFGVIQGGKKD